MEFIDAHTHAYQPDDRLALEAKLALLDGPLPPGNPHRWHLHHEADLVDLVEAEREAGIGRAVLLPVATRIDRVSELNRWSAQAARTFPEIIPFGTLHPNSPFPATDLAEVVILGLKGVKLHSLLQRFNLLDDATLDLIRAIEAAGLPVLLDTLHGPGLLEIKPHLDSFGQEFSPFAASPGQVAELGRIFPDLTIIAAHLGCLYGWDEVGPLYELDNVYFDLAYVDKLLEPDQALAIIRNKGPERVIWGTDAPWREVGPAKDWFLSLDLTDHEKELIASKNILRVIG